jgi:hypothetical protein
LQFEKLIKGKEEHGKCEVGTDNCSEPIIKLAITPSVPVDQAPDDSSQNSQHGHCEIEQVNVSPVVVFPVIRGNNDIWNLKQILPYPAKDAIEDYSEWPVVV